MQPETFSARDSEGRDHWEEWTPTLTDWTEVGTTTVHGRFRVVGAQCFCQVRVTPETTCETAAGTSYVDCPIPATGFAGDGSMGLDPNVTIGSVKVDVANSRVYVPTQAATANTFSIAWWYEV